MPVTSTPVEIKYSVSKLTFINIKRNFSFKNTSSLNKNYKCFYTSLKMKFTKIDKLFFKWLFSNHSEIETSPSMNKEM